MEKTFSCSFQKERTGDNNNSKNNKNDKLKKYRVVNGLK